MKYITSLLLIFLLISCEKDDADFIYSYKITRVNRTPSNFLMDSTIFYYDHRDKLLKISDCKSGNSCLEAYPIYKEDRIVLNDKQYILNSHQRIDSLIHDIDNVVCYEYENDYITHEFLSRNNSVIEEHFYFYSNGIILKDSTIHNKQYITVYNHLCTDTLTPDFMIHYSGFKEYPLKSNYLIRESTAPEAGIKDIRSYAISENELTVYVKTIDLFHNDTVDWPSTKYAYEER